MSRPGAPQPELSVVLIGVGRVGRDLARILAARPGVRVVAAWSRNPAHEGRDLGEVAGAEPSGVAITSRQDVAFAAGADVAVVATTSFLSDVAPVIKAAISTGHNVLCTAEESAYPWAVDPALADRLDAAARANGVTVVGSGANPGFIFDTLVATLALAAPDLTRIRVSRVVDVSRFSATVLRRLGIGFDPEQFAAGRAAGQIWGHIGFPQSMHLVASAFGLALERVEGTVEPLFADRPYAVANLDVGPGESVGFIQRYVGISGGRDWFHAELTGHLDPAGAGLAVQDRIALEGSVPLTLVVDPGFRAQETSAAVLANSIARVVAAPPGWFTVLDLPPATSSSLGGQS